MVPDDKHSATLPQVAARVVIFACLIGTRSLFAQVSEDGGVSRSMNMGIQMFEKGDDARAMDRFMEVITSGDPSERPLANEYINLITRRMNAGEKPAAPRAAAIEPPPAKAVKAQAKEEVIAAAPAAANREIVVEPAEMAAVVAPPVRAAATAVTPPTAVPSVAPVARPTPRAEAPKETSRESKALMLKEIKARTKALKEKSLKQLKAIDGISVLISETGDPLAIGIPSPLLFGTGIGFQKSAAAILEGLTGLAYSLSGAQIIVLPEGTSVGDAKVMDMRRTMGISAHLFSAGIAPPRVKVNLLNSQVDIPRAMQDFKGIVVVFIYNQPLVLAVESPLGEEAGPPISLGVFPENIKPEKGEGSIIEFSVQDPPAGLVSWEFKLLAPNGTDGGELAPLQEVVGGGPVYHQIYWNGRRNYFGDVMAAGRYECMITATDAKNRQKTLHRWIHLIGPVLPPADSAASSAAPQAAARSTSGAPAAELSQDGAIAAPLIKPAGGYSPSRKRRAKPARRPKKRRKPARRKPASPAVKAAPSEAHTKPSATPYELAFVKDKNEMTAEGEKMLAQVAETVAYYPLENLDLVGYAHNAEPDAAALAQKRAQLAAGLLINKYKADPKKIQMHSSVSETPAYKVEVRFVGGP